MTAPKGAPVCYQRINQAALIHVSQILDRWLPHGYTEGQEYVVRNPTRPDRRPGSFKINRHSGAWADFATGDTGGDLISLAAYLFGLSQREAALRLASMLGLGKEGAP